MPRISYAADDELQLTPDQVRAALELRAERLARAPLPEARTAEPVRVVAFSRGGRRFGVPIERLAEIRPLAGHTRVPGAPRHVAGVIQVRGEIVAVVDLAALFGAPEGEPAGSPYAVVVSAAGAAAALLADAVDAVAALPPDRVHAPLATFSGSRARAIRGIDDDGTLLLDVDALLAGDLAASDAGTQQERR